ncbi:MAG: arylsulfatase A-like enzyme [Rhodothermales bacterium]|jgi:arylsulfatase A-like enzyme
MPRPRLVFLFCLLAGSIFAQSAKRPNIVFIFSDDHAYQAISAYGSKINKTPNIDRIANEGMLFQECYVSNSICGPQRAVIQTGKLSHLNGFIRNGNTFNGDQQTFPKLLQKAGYQTAVVGKWHLKSKPQGYDYFEVLKGQGPYYNPPMVTEAGTVKHTGYTTDIISDLTMKWLKEKRDPDKPFMLMTQHKAPHRNWQPGPKYLNKYDDVTIPEPPTLHTENEGLGFPAMNQTMTISRHMNPKDLKLSGQRLNPDQQKVWDAAYGPKNKAFAEAKLEGKELVSWKYQRYVKDYIRCIDSVDDAVGAVLDYLEEAGLAENTIVIYSSDQGFYLGEHGWFDKRWVYEESLRTPFVARWPGTIKPGRKNSDIVSPLDFAQTFLDIAGAPDPGDMQGRSLLHILQGNTPKDWRQTMYFHYYEFPGAHSVRRHYAVVDRRYKLIHFYGKELDMWQLIDLKADPLETKNFYDNPEYKTVQAKLHSELDRLRAEYKVPHDPGAEPKKPKAPKKPRKKPAKK